MSMSAAVEAAYKHLLNQVLEHDTENMRVLGAILLNTYNERLPGTGFPAGRFRHLDHENQAAVLTYLNWFGSTPGCYPPSDDMSRLKQAFMSAGGCSNYAPLPCTKQLIWRNGDTCQAS